MHILLSNPCNMGDAPMKAAAAEVCKLQDGAHNIAQEQAQGSLCLQVWAEKDCKTV